MPPVDAAPSAPARPPTAASSTASLSPHHLVPPAANPDASVEEASVAPASESSSPPSDDPPPSKSVDYRLNAGLGAPPPTVHRETPRDTMEGFLESSRRGDFEGAAHYLHLWGIPPAVQKTRGPDLAQRLSYVFNRSVWFDLDRIPDQSSGAAEVGGPASDDVRVATIQLARGRHVVHVVRVREPFRGQKVWVISPDTVRNIDDLEVDYGVPDYVQRFPAWTRTGTFGGLPPYQWFGLALLTLLASVLGLITERPVLWLLARAERRWDVPRDGDLRQMAGGLVRWPIALLALLVVLPELRLSVTSATALSRMLAIGLIFVATVGGVRAVRLVVEIIGRRHEAEGEDASHMRTVVTRLDALRRVASVLIVIVGLALALMQFPTARTAGLSLLGSAGVAGAILGFAAQKTFANLFAGVLISFTQPIRIGDTVVVENEWGKVEAIGSTHVIVCIWDKRRLIVPVTYFLDKPFENWTKMAPELIGVVLLHTDYRVKVDEVRAELDRILENEPLWDGDVKRVLVVDVTDRTMVLRVTVSARDSSQLWDLRCSVREKLMAYLGQDPDRLPRSRWDRPDLRA